MAYGMDFLDLFQVVANSEDICPHVEYMSALFQMNTLTRDEVTASCLYMAV